MGRFLLILVFVGWMSFTWQPIATTERWSIQDFVLPAYFLSGYLLLILLAAWWNRRLARRVAGDNFSRQLRRFNRRMGLVRMVIPVWFVVGVFFMGWGNLVSRFLWQIGLHPGRYDTPGLLVGCLPAFLAWMGLWWAQYPADICFREQGLLAQLDAGFPIHQPPTLGSYFRVHLRLQLFFTIVPILALVALRDLLSLGLRPLGLDEEKSVVIQLGVSLATAALVLLFAPVLLKRVLHTETLPPGPLRQRLESICRRHHVRYRDVLLWRTDFNMGNAAVMGLIPQVRYILMSDLLLETMTDEQIEAVFAHEVGHVIHRHMLWFAVFFGSTLLGLVALSGPVGDYLDKWLGAVAMSNVIDAAGGLAVAGGMLLLFLFLSRRFERQADVFAARNLHDQQPAADSHVSEHGASLFASALEQVARINCIPVTAWSWCHGSIAHRMDYLRHLSEHPEQTARFDRFMMRLYGCLVIALLGSGVGAIVALLGQRGG
ncbi:MAG TPA: M48 family metallopeptidase [Tepidisphaeraceae bacterium]|nr:M48 family metallopeptidase [Tepidisphaeraceae bacterium]